MDIEAAKRKQLVSLLENDFHCIEECHLKLMGFDEKLRADVVAYSKVETEPWVLAFEVKQPTSKWEMKDWLRALAQAGNYPNCEIIDNRLGHLHGRFINAAFIFPAIEFYDSREARTNEYIQNNYFYREHDSEPLRGAIYLAQHFKVGMAHFEEARNKLIFTLGATIIWNNQRGFLNSAKDHFAKRKIGSRKRVVSDKK